jgi:hypothetical protein
VRKRPVHRGGQPHHAVTEPLATPLARRTGLRKTGRRGGPGPVRHRV